MYDGYSVQQVPTARLLLLLLLLLGYLWLKDGKAIPGYYSFVVDTCNVLYVCMDMQ
ncbi:hypothetical protein BP00DRAFT_422412 [Aspergillus indologenus CBS 114.80]|uniref:Uncharacterized protein n=1 Tax=Aspergillus indologenus CBS 114.80 TaxID=1450541 RepID=A0A2V5J9M8_9EURO|nr:hypothetical protein BP00DRAFT_422412 [Aspergillus indologenus CBS 114.80]